MSMVGKKIGKKLKYFKKSIKKRRENTLLFLLFMRELLFQPA